MKGAVQRNTVALEKMHDGDVYFHRTSAHFHFPNTTCNLDINMHRTHAERMQGKPNPWI